MSAAPTSLGQFGGIADALEVAADLSPAPDAM